MHSFHQAAAHAHATELLRSADRNHGHHVAPPIRAARWRRSTRTAIAAPAERAPIGRPAVTVEPGV